MRPSRKGYFIKTIKASVGAVAAIWLAQLLGLQYATSAGIITLLSLQNTKKETLLTALQRFLAYLAALIIAYISFSVLGFTHLALGLYLLVFVFLCQVFSLHNVIAMCSVLITHFWFEQDFSLSFIWNETLLLIIGAGIGILLNLFLRRNVQAIWDEQRNIEEIIRSILKNMARILTKEADGATPEMEQLEESLALARAKAQHAMNNTLLIDLRYYVEYVDMRKSQYMVLKRMHTLLSRLQIVPKQAFPIAELLQQIAESFHEHNNAEDLLSFTEQVRQAYQTDALPKTRSEFEARAVLFQLLHDIEYFLQLKNIFAQSLSTEQKELFWLRKSSMQ